jgi:hypothetical protein
LTISCFREEGPGGRSTAAQPVEGFFDRRNNGDPNSFVPIDMLEEFIDFAFPINNGDGNRTAKALRCKDAEIKTVLAGNRARDIDDVDAEVFPAVFLISPVAVSIKSHRPP